MRILKAHGLMTAAILFIPSLGLACDYAYRPSTELYNDAAFIFIGKVVESPWRETADGRISTTGKTSLRFSVVKRFRGTAGSEVTIPPIASDCSYPFLEGETYLIHGGRSNGVINTGSPWRPLAIADAREALKYVEQAAAGRTPGLLYGVLTVRGNEKTGVVIRLQGQAGRFESKATAGYYEIVAPPGEYSVWLERDGKPIAEGKTVRLTQGKAVLQNLE